jgi:UDP-N-acetylmuramate dehydrogenase
VTRPFIEKLRRTLAGKVFENEPLARHATWRVGGPADIFIVPADRRDLLRALALLHEAKEPWLALGAGSNLLVRDGGIRGAVIHTGRLRELRMEEGGAVLAGGGLPLMTLIRETARRGLAGLEALAGIPGTVGGAVAMNAGAGGQEMSGVVRSVILTGEEGEEEWDAARLNFGYRFSALPGDRVVTEARLFFRPVDAAVLEKEIRTRIALRKDTQSVGAPNAGSVFKNPPGLSAWRLIDEAGLRGLTLGGAQVAQKHANFIVNTGRATAADILELIDRIRETVLKLTGIELETEVRIVGEVTNIGERMKEKG